MKNNSYYMNIRKYCNFEAKDDRNTLFLNKIRRQFEFYIFLAILQ